MRWFLFLSFATGLYLVLHRATFDPPRAAADFEFHLSEDGAGDPADEYTFDACALGSGAARLRVIYEQSGRSGGMREGLLGPDEIRRFLAALNTCGLLSLQSDGLPWARPQTCIRYREGHHEAYWHIAAPGVELDTLQAALQELDADTSADHLPLRLAYDRHGRTFKRLRPRLINDPPAAPFALDVK